MENIKKKIKENRITIISIVIIFIVLIACGKQCQWISYYTNAMRNTGTKLEFVFPIINKTITNDTFFTIAIGNNVLKDGFTNVDTLTWHDNLEFPHSRNF